MSAKGEQESEKHRAPNLGGRQLLDFLLPSKCNARRLDFDNLGRAVPTGMVLGNWWFPKLGTVANVELLGFN